MPKITQTSNESLLMNSRSAFRKPKLVMQHDSYSMSHTSPAISDIVFMSLQSDCNLKCPKWKNGIESRYWFWKRIFLNPVFLFVRTWTNFYQESVLSSARILKSKIKSLLFTFLNSINPLAYTSCWLTLGDDFEKWFRFL